MRLTRRSMMGTIAASGVAAIAPGRRARADERPQLVIAVNGIPEKLDPAADPLAVDLRVAGSIFDTLIERDWRAEASAPEQGARLIPALATSWTRVDDRTLELVLRHDVKFHNGDTLTAEDVAFTFSRERFEQGGRASFASAPAFLGELTVEIRDPYRVRIRQAHADAVLEHRLSTWAARIVNARAYRTLRAQGFTRAPVGTGPFRLDDWRGGLMRLVAHDQYFGGQPSVRAVLFREVPLLSSRIAGLQAGEFDIINHVAADQMPVIARRSDLEVRPTTIQQWQVLWLSSDRPALADPRRRQALALAIDRNLIVTALQGGLVAAATSFQLPSFAPFYEPRAGLAYDPERARELLRDSGYGNEPVVLRLVANYYAAGEAVAQAIIEMWRAAGVNARLEMVENFAQARGPGRDAVFGGCSYSFPTPEGLGSCFLAPNNWAEQYGFPDGVGNMRALAAQLAAARDATARGAAFRNILDELESQVPAIPLYVVPQHFAAKRTVRWTPYADFAMDLRAHNLVVDRAVR